MMLWVRSYRCTDSFQYATDTRFAAVLSSRGNFLLRFDSIPTTAPTRFAGQAAMTLYWNQRPPEPLTYYWPRQVRTRWSLLGLSFQSGTWLDARRQIAVLPCWFVALMTACLPVRWEILRRGRWRREREAKGKVCRCGYRLAGNTSGVCPECGKAIAS